MATSNLRSRDMKVEREIARFLDKHLYSQSVFTKAKRTDDLEHQLCGSDIIISIPSSNISDAVVDEKAQTQYINRPLPTFAFELSFISSSNSIIEGWFTDMAKSTEYYLLIWISKCKKEWNITAEDIEELDYALVSRKKIHEYLAQFGYNKEQLQEKARKIRTNGIDGQIDKGNNHPYWFYFTTRLAEQPINIVIRKNLLLQLADRHGVLTNGSKAV